MLSAVLLSIVVLLLRAVHCSRFVASSSVFGSHPMTMILLAWLCWAAVVSCSCTASACGPQPADDGELFLVKCDHGPLHIILPVEL